MKKLYTWFTPARRQGIQVWFGSLAPILILLGFATETWTQQALVIIGAVLQFLAALLSLVNISGIIAIWTVIRGAVYALAATVSPALVILGIYDENMSARLILVISLGLTSISSLVAVFTSSKQQLAASAGVEVVKEG